MDYTENTFGWDVLGYYLYLPATFIYDDLETLSFAPEIVKQYVFTPDFQQAHQVENGNYVLKYSCGQAFSYLPFFAIAHVYALNSSYPADGFSKPYQFMINLGAVIIAMIGLFFLRKILLIWFNDEATALTLLSLVFASNYLDYSAINGNLTHNYLFTLYCLIIWCTHLLYKSPNFKKAMMVGSLIGLAALTRPTEIIAVIIPLFWGLSNLRISSLVERFNFFKTHKAKIFAGMCCCVLIGSIQLIYWKWVGGSWLIYSYKEEGFTWLHPHLYDSFLSYKTGWLVYSPVMAFSILGFYFLYKKKTTVFWACLFFALLFTYLVTAWDNWWYGGGLGLRAMVQSYPILAIAMAACFEYLFRNKWTKGLLLLLLPFLIYHNLWLTYNAHKGHQYHAAQMTQAYYWKTIGKIHHDPVDLNLLDTDEYFSGERKKINLIYTKDFEQDTSTWICLETANSDNQKMCLQDRKSRTFDIPFDTKRNPGKWIRAQAYFHSVGREWTYWKMGQFVVRFFNANNDVVKVRMIRINRQLAYQNGIDIYMDIKIPDQPFNKIQLQLTNEYGDVPLIVDDLRVESFE